MEDETPQAPALEDEPEVSADTVAELFFDFLRQLSTLSLAAAGGAVTLMQTVLAESEHQAMLVGGVVALFLAALSALQTQQVLVERLAQGTRTLKPDDGLLGRLKMERSSANEQRLVCTSRSPCSGSAWASSRSPSSTTSCCSAALERAALEAAHWPMGEPGGTASGSSVGASSRSRSRNRSMRRASQRL